MYGIPVWVIIKQQSDQVLIPHVFLTKKAADTYLQSKYDDWVKAGFAERDLNYVPGKSLRACQNMQLLKHYWICLSMTTN